MSRLVLVLPCASQVLAVLLFFSHSALAQEVCGSFDFPVYSIDTFASSFLRENRDAILKVKTMGGEQGTAFLIDSSRGLVLTARHVVKLAVQDTKLPIQGLSPRFPGEELTLKYLRSTGPELDVALLQVQPPEKLAEVASLEISLDPPLRGSNVVYAGFPNDSNTLLTGRGEVFELGQDNRSLTLRDTTLGGDSGSPVFDMRGLVIGLVTDNETSKLGVALSLTATEDFLMRIRPSKRAQTLFRELMNRDPDGKFINRFSPSNSKDHVKNLDLLGVISLINKEEKFSPKQQKRILCPVYYSATDRFLKRPTRYIATKIPPDKAPEWALIQFLLGKNFGSLGRSDLARENFAEARTLLDVASKSRMHLKPKPMLDIACHVGRLLEDGAGVEVSKVADELLSSAGFTQDAIHRIVTSKGDLKSANCGKAESDKVLSAYFRDLALINLEMGNLAGDEDERSLPRGKTLATLATLLSGDTELSGNNLALLGDIARKNNEWEFAAGAYAGAFLRGQTSISVRSNFEESVVKAHSKRVPIEAYNAMTNDKLYDVLVGKGRKQEG